MSITGILLTVIANPAPMWAGPLSFGFQEGAVAPVEQEVAPLGQGEIGPTEASISVGWVWQLRTDLTDTSGGQYALNRGHAVARVKLALSDELDLLIGGRYQRDDFTFSGMVAPWSTINTTSFAAGLQWQADQQLQIFGGGEARWATESGGSTGDGFEVGGAIGAAYAFSRSLVLGGGLGVRSQLEDSALFYPIVVVEWQITDRLALSTQLTTGWANRTGAELVYEVEDGIDVGLAAVFDYQRFRLNSDAPGAGGVGTTEALPVTLFISFELDKRASVTGFVGATVYGRLKRIDANGTDQWTSDQDPAPVLGIQGTIRF
ncbi:MAG: hypothetical protein MK100_00140 [Phycisphaerales bacterium]|nr:hypothetical protein [Phycisphaerales bacterium]